MSRLRPAGERTPATRENKSQPASEDRRVTPLLTKHLARVVNRGQRITVHLGNREVHTGYPAAHDDTSIYLLIPHDTGHTDAPKFTRKIILWAHVSSVDLHDEATLQHEPARAEMEQIFANYRSRMVRDHLGRRPSPGGTA